jgi:hypothetical protein
MEIQARPARMIPIFLIFKKICLYVLEHRPKLLGTLRLDKSGKIEE